uniref:GB1/RHD3-type G domain-containing protein n=1 Tax=Oncorhynchus tshawytscha TaxID=74940 RepID=A0A8C8MKU9_ONCTS
MDSPMCLVKNADGELCVEPEAIDYLMGLKQKVVVVSVVGLYRTGKSYLMNKLAQKRSGFALGATIQSKTKGIWMWCVPHPEKTDHTLVLLDTEGLGDVEKGDSKNDAWIFSLAILLSSTLVYNSRGTIDNDAVEKLQYVNELTEMIKVKSSTDDEEEGEGTQFMQFFPNFVWTVRDFTLQLKIDGRVITPDQYLENSLQLKKECIRNFFPSRKCFVFPSPTTPDNMHRLDSMDEAELSERFREVADTFCLFIFQESRMKTVIGGHTLTGEMLGHLLTTYVETIAKGNVPCLENAVMAIAKIENQAAVDEGLAVYQKGMKDVKALFPVNINQLSENQLRSETQATKAFMKRSFKDENGEFLKALAEAISNHTADLFKQNKDASEKKCKALLEKLSAQMDQGIKEGTYATPGGYDHLVTAEEVLEQFLKDKSAESNSILQADKQLTKKDKQIQAEKKKTAELEQEKAAFREQQAEMKRRIENNRISQEKYLKEMKEKMEEERNQQQQEFNRTLERRMQEQKDLLENGHKEKAELMRQEIEEIKKKNQLERDANTRNQEALLDELKCSKAKPDYSCTLL